MSLDDFGTGYSSLAHLRRLPLSSVKIDRSFVANVDTDPQARSFIAAVIRLGQDLGLDVIVEGIETAGQLATVRELGATFVQGYLVDLPRPAHEVEVGREWTDLFTPTALGLPRQRESVDAFPMTAGRAAPRAEQ
jgi:EAL domain-containing protein (putative c-di-GMP-specific phosphodiesterase class I)